MSKARDYLKLGRVSNLPTVWTNVAAGAALGAAPGDPGTLLALGGAMSLAYVGGMFLNDAFDRNVDAVERPERPIPSGRVTAREVFAVGFGLLAAAVALVAGVALAATPRRPSAIAAAVALAVAILLYDAWHKRNPLSPVIMGTCRGAVYVTAALGAGGALTPPLALGAASLVAYVVGLTFVARYETAQRFGAWAALALLAVPALVAASSAAGGLAVFAAIAAFAGWTVFAVMPLFAGGGSRNVPAAVARMIAGICLVDGMLAAASGRGELAVAAVAGLFVTMLSQRFVRGT